MLAINDEYYTPGDLVHRIKPDDITQKWPQGTVGLLVSEVQMQPAIWKVLVADNIVSWAAYNFKRVISNDR